MEIIFIRHAQGEHTTNLPNSLDIRHPALTEKGKVQARNLTEIFDLKPTDIIITSPTRSFVGPRMFPQNPEWVTLACDEI